MVAGLDQMTLAWRDESQRPLFVAGFSRGHDRGRVPARIIDVELDEAAQVGLDALRAEGMTESEAIRAGLVEAAAIRERQSRRRSRRSFGAVPGSAVIDDDLDTPRVPG